MKSIKGGLELLSQFNKRGKSDVSDDTLLMGGGIGYTEFLFAFDVGFEFSEGLTDPSFNELTKCNTDTGCSKTSVCMDVSNNNKIINKEVRISSGERMDILKVKSNLVENDCPNKPNFNNKQNHYERYLLKKKQVVFGSSGCDCNNC